MGNPTGLSKIPGEMTGARLDTFVFYDRSFIDNGARHDSC